MRSDEIWDEERWEAYLRENDRRISHFMEIFRNFLSAHPAPRRGDKEGYKLWRDRLREYFEVRGAFIDENMLAFLLADEEQIESESNDIWFPEISSDILDESEDEIDDFRQNPVLRSASRLATEVLEWANRLPGALKDSTLVQYCSCITQIGANVAKGHLMGLEHDTIGGNIAYAKRGLHAANTGLQLMSEMKREPYMDAEVYRRLYERTFEVRNLVALYVLDLRERYNMGID